MSGASLCMPDRWLQAEPLCRFMNESLPTLSGAVPTVWNDVLGYLDKHPEKKPESLRLILCGGSAVPSPCRRRSRNATACEVLQAWGMTETSPVASAGLPPVGADGEDEWTYRGSQGRVACGVEGRIVADDGNEQPVGRQRPSASSRSAAPGSPAATTTPTTPRWTTKFHDGWLRTGDVGSIDELGYIRLSDRAKDVIKSGGEWISSVDLENALMAHDDVVEAAVIGIPDEKWGERPLASVVVREGATLTPAELREFLSKDFAKWQLPDVVGLHRRGAAHQRRQVRQEGDPQVVRRRRDRGRERRRRPGATGHAPRVGLLLQLEVEEGVDRDARRGSAGSRGDQLEQVGVALPDHLGEDVEAAGGDHDVDDVGDLGERLRRPA